jgi:hypothetical protein
MPDEKKKLKLWGSKKLAPERKKVSNATNSLIYTILHFRDTPQTKMITYTTQFIFLAGGYDKMESDGYEGTNYAFGLKYLENASHKKVPYGLKRVATVLDAKNKSVPAGEEWELGEWKKNGVKLLNTRDPESSSFLFHTLKGSGSSNNPIFVAVFGKQNEKLIPRKIAPEHRVFIYQHPTSREPLGVERHLESLAEDITEFSEANTMPNEWYIGQK